VISIETRMDAVRTLESTKGELKNLARATESEIGYVARAFEALTAGTDTLLNLAAGIIGGVESGRINSVLPSVQSLGTAAMRFIGDRLQAASGILGMANEEVELLRRLSSVTRGQATLALETKGLSVLTNIEVSHLGAAGASFQYLAHELSEFSKSAMKETMGLATRTHARKAVVEETNRALATDLPRQHDDMRRIQVDLGNALAVVDASLAQLFGTPAKFRMCMEDIARQIAGVVAAVQAHDITRQQIGHVGESFDLISTRLGLEITTENEAARELGLARAGLAIQVYQLRAIKTTVAGWVAQIRTCLAGIVRVSVSDLVGIGPAVMEAERELSSLVARIELLGQQSQAYSRRIHHTLDGLSNLMQLLDEHVRRSRSVGSHLQLLTFNSIIEASHLGTHAVAILAIAECIKGIAGEWRLITDQSGLTVEEILRLVRRTNEVMAAFSDVQDNPLSEARMQTQAGLEALRAAAAFAARKAQEMKTVTGEMQATTTALGSAADHLDGCFRRLDVVLAETERVKCSLETKDPAIRGGYDAAEVEGLFSALYTTEMEREILRAALRGAPLPVAQPPSEGNGVELF